MKKKITVSVLFALLLTSCALVYSPKPAPVQGDLPAKVKILQLNQTMRELLGANDKDEVIALVGSDGALTLFGAPGQGFRVEADKGSSPTERGVVNKVIVTTTKNSPVCNKIQFGGWIFWYPSPPCPVQ